MEHAAPCSSRTCEEPEFNLKEWELKARIISRENTISRRYSASNIRSFREDTKSFRSNFTISSTASSPGYPFRDEIDPATYSFTTALKALQARSGYVWDCLSPEGFALNSKWNDAEKYICNPLSGEVPIECLSAKTLSGISFRNTPNRITMSAPLTYPSHTQKMNNPYSTKQEDAVQIPIAEKKVEITMTRDVGTQSNPADLSSSSPSPTSTPSIFERNSKNSGTEIEESCFSNAEQKSNEEGNDKERREEVEEEETKREDEEMSRCRCRREGAGPGCLSWMRKRQKKKHKHNNKKRNNNTIIFIPSCISNPKVPS